MAVKKAETGEQGSVSKDNGCEEEMELGDEARGFLLSRGARFSSMGDFLSFLGEDEAVIEDKISEEEGGKVAIEVNKAETETMEEQSSVDTDEEDELEIGNEAGKSLLTRGVKFSSVCDFLSFMNEGEASTVEKGKEISEKEDGKVQLYPVVKLKRLSLKAGDIMLSKVKRRSKVRVRRGHKGSILKGTIMKQVRMVRKTWWTNMPVAWTTSICARSVSTLLDGGHT